jgi:MFS family permease
MLPLLLKNYLEPVNYWMLLLPLSGVGMATMMTSSRLADQGKTRTVLVVGFLLVIYTGTSLIFGNSYTVVYLAIFAYYIGYSILEPILATAVTKFAHPEIRGTTVGIFNMFQAIGNFFGGILAGGLYLLHRDLLFGALAIIGFLGLLAILSLRLKHKPGF